MALQMSLSACQLVRPILSSTLQCMQQPKLAVHVLWTSPRSATRKAEMDRNGKKWYNLRVLWAQVVGPLCTSPNAQNANVRMSDTRKEWVAEDFCHESQEPDLPACITASRRLHGNLCSRACWVCACHTHALVLSHIFYYFWHDLPSYWHYQRSLGVFGHI